MPLVKSNVGVTLGLAAALLTSRTDTRATRVASEPSR